ncbi:MAG: type IV secretion system protein VirB10 [Piscinibacter sp.]|uniref:type IV secretion system protein VirB10 n=1 Tax=Piscinibacter sp. TaxID=1903157 RepID=UPI002590FA44|nr:type IV secretion system protein VirB10 [Piscinibacter sp.]MCW5662835.1 type IV secretion system protein VirB10 [Piscinibacter sp.]
MKDPSGERDPRLDDDIAAEAAPNTIAPLPGEPGIPDVAAPRRVPISKKGLLAVVFLIVSLVAVLAFSIQRLSAGGRKAGDPDAKLVGERPAAASTEPRRLELPATPRPAASAADAPRIPALVPTDEEAEPIGVRRTGSGAPATGSPKGAPPEDAPVLLVTTRPGAPVRRGVAESTPAEAEVDPSTSQTDPSDPLTTTTRNLQGYQRQLQGLMDSLTRSAAMATGQSAGPPPSGALLGGPSSDGPATSGLFGGQLQGSGTARVAASLLGNRSLTLPKGTAFTCALKTKVISATPGLVGCQVQRNVFSDDGRVLLVERGSHLDGEYRILSLRPGSVRIPVLWTRIRTPQGVTVDIESPGTGQLGESGIDGHLDNRWGERIGAAMLLSLIDDSVKIIVQNQAPQSQADTVVLPSTTANTSKLAEKVLDSTINIPPLIYRNQGGVVGIVVARDVDFSSVYELQPSAR